MPSRAPDHGEGFHGIDEDRLRSVLVDHPVRLAVLFGSLAGGDTHPESDVDIAVEFTDAVEDVPAERLSLLTDLSIGLDRNDVDLSLVNDLKPEVGLAAFTQGHLVVGSETRKERHRRGFEREVERLNAGRPSLRERFDSAIDGVDRALDRASQ